MTARMLACGFIGIVLAVLPETGAQTSVRRTPMWAAEAPPAGDDCAGTSLVASFHFEDTEATPYELTVGEPPGCTDDTVVAYTFVYSGITVSAAQYSDGTHSVYSIGESRYVQWDLAEDHGASAIGTVCSDVRINTATIARPTTFPTAYGIFKFFGSSAGDEISGYITRTAANASTLDLTCGNGYLTAESTTNIPDDTWTRICATWDATHLATKVGAAAWQVRTTTCDARGTDTVFTIAGNNADYMLGYYDNVRIYSAYQAE